MNLPIDGQNHDVVGTITQVGQTMFLPSGTPYQDCIIDGERVRVWQGNGSPIPQQVTGTQQAFTLKAEQKGKYTNRGGFWKQNAKVQQQPQQQMPPQANNNVYQPPSQQKKSEPDWDKIAEGKVLCNVVCAAIQSAQIQVATTADATKWTDFIMGKRTEPQQPQPEPEYGGPQYDPDEQGIPF